MAGIGGKIEAARAQVSSVSSLNGGTIPVLSRRKQDVKYGMGR